MGTINGHARPIVGGFGALADHTNVSCTGNPGRLWVCLGVPPAGPIICSGNGSTFSADCFSKPALALGRNDTAGILFAVTGFCHQASNRILFSANQLINNKCRGIRASVALYGLYGIPTQMLKVRWALKGRFKAIIILNQLIKNGDVVDWINKINTCVNLQGDIPPCIPPAGVVPPPLSLLPPQETELIKNLINLYLESNHWGEDDLYMESILWTLTQGMTETDREELRIPVYKFITNYLSDHADLAGAFLENDIDTATFVESSNGNILGYQEALVGVLGVDQFKIGMNAQIDEFYNLIDPELAMETYGNEFTMN